MAVEVSKYSLLLTFFLALCKNAMNVRRLFSSTQYISIVRFAVNPEAKNYYWGWLGLFHKFFNWCFMHQTQQNLHVYRMYTLTVRNWTFKFKFNSCCWQTVLLHAWQAGNSSILIRDQLCVNEQFKYQVHWPFAQWWKLFSFAGSTFQQISWRVHI